MNRKNKVIFIFYLILVNLGFNTQIANAQNQLYSNEFDLNQIELHESPFSHAQEINIETLLAYDTDRLLEPFLKEAGLTPKGKRFSNWDGLSGHVGGHYLTALAMNYASAGNSECESRMDYMLDELKKCQDKNGNGYLGGIPNGLYMWNELKKGNFGPYNEAWVPWYNIHKTYAGLRDAWLYGEREIAKEMFIQLCDWGLTIIDPLSTSQIQKMLDTEFGGMNEVYADAYQMTGDKKYLEAAKKFTHNKLFNALKNGTDNLDNMHANTQIPKVVGFARIAALDHTASDYAKAARFFWDRVVNYRSLALGGNSRSEHFPTAEGCKEYISHREGPESCNTYNMLKLSEYLFQIDWEADYIDFYERALYNHILSTQHPKHGGYVYFTPARPRHYRVYSTPNQAMWCCVGSGMENHGKYGQMIYTQHNDELYVNLFIPSTLKWEGKNIELVQSTRFPNAATSTLVVNTTESESFKLMIRFPSWAKKEEFNLTVNNENIPITSEPGSYISIERNWSNGDKIDINFPMHISFEKMPNVPEYLAFLYGPILLGAKTGNTGLVGLKADDGRWAHIANGELMPLNTAPIIQGNTDSLSDGFVKKQGEEMAFSAADLFPNQPQYQSLVFEPFANIHDSRYSIYWMNLSHEEYDEVMAKLAIDEKEAVELDQRTVDRIACGEQQPDADHKVDGKESYTGVYNNEFYRDARNGGYFSYELSTQGNEQLELLVRYWGNEWGSRTFDIMVDDQIIATENVSGKWQVEDFVNVEYTIPEELLKGKEYITVKFSAKANHTAGGVYFLRLLMPSAKQTSIDNSIKNKDQIKIQKKKDQILFRTEKNSGILNFKIFTSDGSLVKTGKFENNQAHLNKNEFSNGVYMLFYKQNGQYNTQKFHYF